MLSRYLQKVLLLLPCFLLFSLGTSAVTAHEAWIEPLKFEIAVGDTLQAHLKVGQTMEGDTYAFFPGNFKRFDLAVNGKTTPLAEAFGQSPAVVEPVTESGLHILTYQSRPSRLRYSERAKFESFLKNEGIEWVLEAHEKRGLPPLDFVELYTRYSKSLVKVGDGAGQDQAQGMSFEWVLQTNPYTTPDSEAVTALLLFEGKPFPNSFVVVFRKQGEAVERLTYRTDEAGLVTIPVDKGGVFLVNSVHMIEPTPEYVGKKEGDWLSLWASVTFEVK